MQQIPSDHPIETWETEIGRFVVAFSALEQWMHAFVLNLGAHDLHSETVDFQLGTRVKLVRGLLGGSRLSPEMRDRARQVLDDVMQLAVTRNLIVHNSVYVDLFPGPDGDLHLQLGLRSVRKPEKWVSLETIQESTKQAEDLFRRLTAIFYELQKK